MKKEAFDQLPEADRMLVKMTRGEFDVLFARLKLANQAPDSATCLAVLDQAETSFKALRAFLGRCIKAGL